MFIGRTMNFWLLGLLKLSLNLKLLLLDFNSNFKITWHLGRHKLDKNYLYNITRSTMRFRFLGLFLFRPQFFFFFTMYICIATRYNLGKTSQNFHSFRNDPLHLKTLNFTPLTSNLMQCPPPFGLGIKSNGKMGEITFLHLELL